MKSGTGINFPLMEIKDGHGMEWNNESVYRVWSVYIYEVDRYKDTTMNSIDSSEKK